MRIKYAVLAAITTAVGALAPAAQANHQYGDAFLGRPKKTAPTESATLLEPGGFDWGDAVVGAVVALGTVLVLIGLALVARELRSRAASSSRLAGM